MHLFVPPALAATTNIDKAGTTSYWMFVTSHDRVKFIDHSKHHFILNVRHFPREGQDHRSFKVNLRPLGVKCSGIFTEDLLQTHGGEIFGAP